MCGCVTFFHTLVWLRIIVLKHQSHKQNNALRQQHVVGFFSGVWWLWSKELLHFLFTKSIQQQTWKHLKYTLQLNMIFVSQNIFYCWSFNSSTLRTVLASCYDALLSNVTGQIVQGGSWTTVSNWKRQREQIQENQMIIFKWIKSSTVTGLHLCQGSSS